MSTIDYTAIKAQAKVDFADLINSLTGQLQAKATDPTATPVAVAYWSTLNNRIVAMLTGMRGPVFDLGTDLVNAKNKADLDFTRFMAVLGDYTYQQMVNTTVSEDWGMNTYWGTIHNVVTGVERLT